MSGSIPFIDSGRIAKISCNNCKWQQQEQQNELRSMLQMKTKKKLRIFSKKRAEKLKNAKNNKKNMRQKSRNNIRNIYFLYLTCYYAFTYLIIIETKVYIFKKKEKPTDFAYVTNLITLTILKKRDLKMYTPTHLHNVTRSYTYKTHSHTGTTAEKWNKWNTKLRYTH